MLRNYRSYNMRNDKYFEPWNERTIKFQRQDAYPWVPFEERDEIKFDFGSIVEHVLWWSVVAIGLYLWLK